MNQQNVTAVDKPNVLQVTGMRFSDTSPVVWVRWLIVLVLFTLIYRRAFGDLWMNWSYDESYYSHGFLIPPISLFFVWRARQDLAKLSLQPANWGYLCLFATCLYLIVAIFLGFRVLEQLSIVPMVFSLILILFGWPYAKRLWFPILFLLFMIPLPASMTQSIVLDIKILATELSVRLAQLFTLPMIRDGSYVHFGDDFLLVGEVCGGLRSLIALLAFGAVMAYISRTRNWARIFIFMISAPVAIISNVVRIFFLCVVGYMYGSENASGKVHDISGILIFAVAFVLLFSLESFLRKVAPARESEETDK